MRNDVILHPQISATVLEHKHAQPLPVDAQYLNSRLSASDEIYARAQKTRHDYGGMIAALFNSRVGVNDDNLGHGLIAAKVQLHGIGVEGRWWFSG